MASITWNDAAMYCNWLTSGDVTKGLYSNKRKRRGHGNRSGRSTAAYGRIYFLPTEDEWYKAAFYDPNKPGGPGIGITPTRHDDPEVPDGIDFAGDTVFDAGLQ